MIGFKSKSTKTLLAAAGVAVSMAGLTVAASPASAAYAPTCSNVPSTVHRGYGYTLACSHFPASKSGGSVYLKVVKGNKTVTYVFGKFFSGHLGNANPSFVISDNAPLGSQVLHIAIGGKVVVEPTAIRR